MESSTWRHERIPQGWSASPKIAKDAMSHTFQDSTMTEFKKDNNISDIDFPPSTYKDILETFVDDLAVYTPKTLPTTYKGKFNAMQLHLIAIDSIFYALNKFNWLISLRKSTVAKPQFIFLGATWDLNNETVGINNDRLSSIFVCM